MESVVILPNHSLVYKCCQAECMPKNKDQNRSTRNLAIKKCYCSSGPSIDKYCNFENCR